VTDTPSSAIPTGRKIAGYTGWNLFGLCAPMVAAFFAFPLLLRGLGEERFGVLSLVWLLVGYLNLLDLGMGRAMTKLTAEAIGLGRRADVPRIFWTALALMAALGLAGGLALAALSDWLATSRLAIPPAMQGEVRTAFRIVAAALPFTIAVTGLVGMLETNQNFRLINLVRVPVGMGTFLAPLAVLAFTRSLVWVVAALIAVRLLELLVYLAGCLRLVPGLRARPRPDRAMVRPLLTFGGWLTVSNVTMPIMLQVDRFIVGAVQTLSNVAYYSVASELVVKFLILPRAWVSALFPPLTMHFANRSAEADRLFARAVKGLALAMLPAVLGLYALAPEFLCWWVGPDVGLAAAPILRMLTVGIFVYSLAYLAFSLLQSAGRPDRAACWHLIELVPFMLAAAWATRRWGITGMATVWTIRCAIEALVLYPLALRHVPAALSPIARTFALSLLTLAPLPLLSNIPNLLLRCAAAALLALASFALSWRLLLTPSDRTALLSPLRRR
jgi:O-antigen/teichoic acid export membrane protein